MDLELAGPDDAIAATPLSGGIASDIAAVGVKGRKHCVKFSLPKLRVEED